MPSPVLKRKTFAATHLHSTRDEAELPICMNFRIADKGINQWNFKMKSRSMPLRMSSTED